MTRPSCLLLWASIGLFAAFASPFAWAAGDAPPKAAVAVGATQSPDKLSTEDANPVGAWSAYDKEPNFNREHTVGEIAIGVAVALVLAWIFGFKLVLRMRGGDVFPAPVRDRLDRLDAARLAAVASAWRLKSRKPDAELLDEKQLYEGLAAEANAALDKARQDLKLNSVDAEFLIPEIDALIARAKALSTRLQSEQLPQASSANRGEAFKFLWAAVNRINRGWELAVARGKELKLVAIAQLNAMRWPSWSRLDALLQ